MLYMLIKNRFSVQKPFYYPCNIILVIHLVELNSATAVSRQYFAQITNLFYSFS